MRPSSKLLREPDPHPRSPTGTDNATSDSPNWSSRLRRRGCKPEPNDGSASEHHSGPCGTGWFEEVTTGCLVPASMRPEKEMPQGGQSAPADRESRGASSAYPSSAMGAACTSTTPPALSASGRAAPGERSRRGRAPPARRGPRWIRSCALPGVSHRRRPGPGPRSSPPARTIPGLAGRAATSAAHPRTGAQFDERIAVLNPYRRRAGCPSCEVQGVVHDMQCRCSAPTLRRLRGRRMDPKPVLVLAAWCETSGHGLTPAQ